MIKQAMLLSVIITGVFFSMQPAMAEDMAMGNQGMVTVYHCAACDLTLEKPGMCPMCGMDLEEKQMTAADAQAAMDAAKAKMRNLPA